MTVPPPRPAADISPADWLVGRINLFGDGNWVEQEVGAGFEAYARIFHSVDRYDGGRWADLAARNGRVMHGLALWGYINTAAGHAPADDDRDGWRDINLEGVVGDAQLRALCDVLARHTSTPEVCWLAEWEGWGWIGGGRAVVVSFVTDGPAPPPRTTYAPPNALVASAPLFGLPHRNYHLLSAPIADLPAITDEYLEGDSPSLFWPDDHAWCVATEIDLDYTLVGGSRALIDELVESQQIEAYEVAADAPWGDEINYKREFPD